MDYFGIFGFSMIETSLASSYDSLLKAFEGNFQCLPLNSLGCRGRDKVIDVFPFVSEKEKDDTVDYVNFFSSSPLLPSHVMKQIFRGNHLHKGLIHDACSKHFFFF